MQFSQEMMKVQRGDDGLAVVGLVGFVVLWSIGTLLSFGNFFLSLQLNSAVYNTTTLWVYFAFSTLGAFVCILAGASYWRWEAWLHRADRWRKHVFRGACLVFALHDVSISVIEAIMFIGTGWRTAIQAFVFVMHVILLLFSAILLALIWTGVLRVEKNSAPHLDEENFAMKLMAADERSPCLLQGGSAASPPSPPTTSTT